MLKKKLTEVSLICLLRGLYKRIDWDKIPRTRRPEIPREMQDSLYVLALKAGAGESAPTVDKLIELVANRFNARLQPFTFTTREGAERQTFMAYAEVPRSLLTRIEKEIGRKLQELPPAFDPESGEERQAKGSSTVARVPWMALARALDYDTVQLVIEQSAPAIVSYVTTSPQTDEDRERSGRPRRGRVGPAAADAPPSEHSLALDPRAPGGRIRASPRTTEDAMRLPLFAAIGGMMVVPGCYPETTSEEDAGEVVSPLPPGAHNGDKTKCYDACRATASKCFEACKFVDDEAYLECVSECAAGYGDCMSNCDNFGGCNLGVEGC